MEGVALYSYRRLSAANKEDGRGVRAGNEIAKHFAGNNVDVIIYAVEKSLDSYKFNLLHCKQTFISQLKSGALGARTIDEGAMDEKSGMNFSEYMALLSGNTDLLDKAKLEKKIASLEGERKSWGKGKRDSEFKLEAKTGELRNNTAVINAMTEDWNRFLSVVKTDKEGNRLNAVKEDGVSSSDEKVIRKRLQEIAKNATTGGLYVELAAIAAGYAKIIEESAGELKELQDIVNPTDMSLTDKDRIDVVQRVYGVLRHHRDLTRYYTRKNISISLLRAARKRDMEGVLSLYGTDEQRYW